jgi:hypothetical protein
MAGAVLIIRDEAISGDTMHEWMLHVLSERLTVRELIRSRVYQEVQDYNQQKAQIYRGLVQPEEAEKALNGWKLKKRRRLDWKTQFEKAVQAFEARQILILVGERQAESLDEEFDLGPTTVITFLRLVLLVGG